MQSRKHQVQLHARYCKPSLATFLHELSNRSVPIVGDEVSNSPAGLALTENSTSAMKSKENLIDFGGAT